MWYAIVGLTGTAIGIVIGCACAARTELRRAEDRARRLARQRRDWERQAA